MSLTATLLLKLPVRLPKGKARTITSDTKPPSGGQRNQATQLANDELVFRAILAGHSTILKIEDATHLSNKTVIRALRNLESYPDGPRILRIVNGNRTCHHFQAVSSQPTRSYP